MCCARFITGEYNENYVTPFTYTVRAALGGIANDLRGKTIERRTRLLCTGESSRVAPAGYAGILRRCHRSIRRDLLPVHEASCKMRLQAFSSPITAR